MLNNKDMDWRLHPEHSLLLLVDVQEKLQPLIHQREKIEKNCVILLRAAAEFKLPVLLTEQYPKGLGPTVHEVKEAAEAAGASIYAKTRFSVLTDDIRPALEASGRRQIILCGVETHICIAQTAMDLLAEGYDVRIASDATGSREAEHRLTALAQLRHAGAKVQPVEGLLFELLDDAKAPQFKAINNLIK